MHRPRPHRSWLAFLRLSLTFIALCLALGQFEITLHDLRDQTVGFPSPWFTRDPLPPPSQLPFLGISLDSTKIPPDDAAVAYAELAETGFGWVRVRVAWDEIEPMPNSFAWASLDHTLDELIAVNLTPILLLDGSPAWARAPNDRTGDMGRLAPPDDPATFARFAHSVAVRYGAHVRYYQIWDEPNIAPHWGSRHIEPVDYARLLKAAATSIRASDADAYIITAALAPTTDRGHLAQDEEYFLNRLYAAGAAPYLDAVAIQPFGFAQRPDAAVRSDTLNFRRTLLIRQAMLDAGDGTSGIWLMRFGWNREPGSAWQSVRAALQREFAFDALATAYRQWPWVVGMGWPTISTLPDAPTAGFALNPELAATFQTAATTILIQPRPQHTLIPHLTLWTPFALWLLAILLLLWRGIAAARGLPWRRWGIGWAARPAWQQMLAWAILLLLYHLAVWPPLLLLYALVAALGLLAQPRIGLALALLLLPLYDYHKEFDWLGQHWQIPPTQAILICLLPAMLLYRPQMLRRDRWQGVAMGWLVVMLLSATGVWNWNAYGIGMLNLVITPLLLFGLIRAWVTTPQQGEALVMALAVGGLLIAGVGLVTWAQGVGTEVDGMRRLTGLGFSSNQTALYLLRSLALALGLTLAAKGARSWPWAMWTLLIAVALLLTGSRGALFLGIPTGALYIFSRQNLRLPARRYLVSFLLVAGAAMTIIAWLWRARLANIESIFARMDGWIVAHQLWLAHLLFGVGPDGFWWTFPAYIGFAPNADPNLRHPHLIWLEFATSGGLLALIWLVVVALLLVRWVRQSDSTFSWLQVGLLTGLIASVAHAQVDAFQALPELAGWNWAALALLLAFDHVRANEGQK